MAAKKLLCAVIGALVSIPATAATQPQAMDMGPLKFVPTLGLSHRYDDNIFRQAEPNEVDSWVTVAAPQLQLIGEKDANMFALTYMGDYGIYADSSADNYTDHTLSLDAMLEANDQNRFKLAASTAMLHDNRGEGSSEGVIAGSRAEPDEYDATGISGVYDFGHETAVFGLALSAGTTDVEYQNNLSETSFRDRNDTDLGIKLYGRLSGKTRAFVELVKREIDYDVTPIAGAILDSEEQNVLVGAEWDITGKTTGSVKVGRLDKDFEAASLTDSDFVNWQAMVSWAPRSYSLLSLVASKTPQETNGTGSFIESSSYSLFWMHDWSDRLHSSVDAGFGKDIFVDDPRIDDRKNYGISLNYDFDRWFNVGVGYVYTDRESNANQFDFDRGQFRLSLSASL